MYHYTSKHIYKLRLAIIRHNLSAPAGFFGTPIKTLRACYNGIGPDRWSPLFRRWVTKLLEYFEPECLIHDWEFAFQPRTYWHFTIANARMIVNTFLYACATYSQPVCPVFTSSKDISRARRALRRERLREFRQAKRIRRRAILRQTRRAFYLAMLCQLGGWSGYRKTRVDRAPCA